MANRESRVSVEKTAMVQPPPLGPTVQLALLLQMIGNNRAYTVISHEGNVWTIHFEGDYDHTVIRFEGDKPEVL